MTASAQAAWKANCASKKMDYATITFDSQTLLYNVKNIDREFHLDSVTNSTMTYAFSGATFGGYDKIIMPNFDNNEEVVNAGNVFKVKFLFLTDISPNYGKVISYNCKSY